MDCVDTVKTIRLTWDYMSFGGSVYFAGVVEEHEGVRRLRILDKEAGRRLSSEVDSSWSADLPQYDFNSWR